MRQATGTFSRRRPTGQQIDGAPYRPQELVVGRYLIRDTVGSGPLGYVFRAQDKEIDVEVALKVINPKLVQTDEERKAFAKQLRGARKLSHPNLVRVYEEGQDGDRPFFTSQFLDGLTLRKIIDLRLQKGQFFALHEIEPILAQVCSALEGAHKVGPHSDIKPDNVLVLPDLLKVTDFGLGLAIPRLPFVQAMKARKADRYLAPEFVEGGEVDGRVDIYALGVIIGEMLSGLTPDGSIPELSRRNPDVPHAVEGLYRRAVNANPNARHKSAAELIGDYIEVARKHSPPSLAKAKPEPASGVAAPARPRTTTGMLQLQPRREKPPPPVTDLPPPPPPMSGENALPDATQPVDSVRLKAVLDARPARESPEDVKANREETAVIDSGQFLKSIDDDVDTRAMAEAVAPAEDGRSTMTWVIVVLLAVLGVGLGAGGGYYGIQKQKAAAEEKRKAAEELKRQADEKARKDAEDAARAAQGALTPEQKAAEEKAQAEKAAAEKSAGDKLSAERLAQEKAAADKVAQEKAAADKAAQERAAADKAAAAEKFAQEKAAAEKFAQEKAQAAAEKAKATQERAGKEKKPVEVAAVSASATRAAGDGPCPEGMRAIAGGPFRMGTAADDPMRGFDEKALSTVAVSPYCIDAFEYPNKRGAAPMASVTHQDAERLCESQGKRLCSESEWEKACKGPGGAKWPYGATFDAAACNTEDDTGDSRSLASAGKFAKCKSAYGVSDLSGNVAEWTQEKLIKGGSFASGDYAVRCSARKNGTSFAKSSEVGFRCCADQK